MNDINITPTEPQSIRAHLLSNRAHRKAAVERIRFVKSILRQPHSGVKQATGSCVGDWMYILSLLKSHVTYLLRHWHGLKEDGDCSHEYKDPNNWNGATPLNDFRKNYIERAMKGYEEARA